MRSEMLLLSRGIKEGFMKFGFSVFFGEKIDGVLWYDQRYGEKYRVWWGNSHFS